MHEIFKINKNNRKILDEIKYNISSLNKNDNLNRDEFIILKEKIINTHKELNKNTMNSKKNNKFENNNNNNNNPDENKEKSEDIHDDLNNIHMKKKILIKNFRISKSFRTWLFNNSEM